MTSRDGAIGGSSGVGVRIVGDVDKSLFELCNGAKHDVAVIDYEAISRVEPSDLLSSRGSDEGIYFAIRIAQCHETGGNIGRGSLSLGIGTNSKEEHGKRSKAEHVEKRSS